MTTIGHALVPLMTQLQQAGEVLGPETDVWFEVSATTGRIHFHGSADGSALLGLSLPAETLLARNGPSPLLEELLDVVDKRCALTPLSHLQLYSLIF